jgi:hypothetical protein
MTPWLTDIDGEKSKTPIKYNTILRSNWAKYFQQADVREALHIPSYVPPFEFSNEKSFKSYDIKIEGSLFINDVLHMHGYKMLMIFGDTDGACSLLGLRKWVKYLGWKPTKNWAPWFSQDESKYGGS